MEDMSFMNNDLSMVEAAGVEPLADEQRRIGIRVDLQVVTLSRFQQFFADFGGTLRIRGAFIRQRIGIDGVKADSGRVNVHGSLQQLKGQFECRNARREMGKNSSFRPQQARRLRRSAAETYNPLQSRNVH
jgi:hypothetical protein